MTPSQLWTGMGALGLVLSLYLMYRGIRRFWVLRHEPRSTQDLYMAWALMAIDIMCLSLFSVSSWVGVITWDDAREWTIFVKVGIAYQFSLLVCIILFIVFTEWVRHQPNTVGKI